jgi:steroid delta-isomerase-like uncharacterized protein
MAKRLVKGDFMSEITERNKAVIRRHQDEVWNKRNFDYISMAIADEIVHISPTSAEPLRSGPKGEEELVAAYRRAFPDVHLTMEQLIAEDDMVASCWWMEGTHLGKLGEIEPTGKRIKVMAVSMDRLVDGKIVQAWVSWNTLGLLQQLGVVGPIALR